jgi:quinol monooxygenase YgiN
MWAQIVKTKVKPGHESEVDDVRREFETRPNPAMVRSMTFANQENPLEHYIVTIFDSEELARHHERHPQQHELVMRLHDHYQEPPEFIDLELIYEVSR